MWGTELGPFLDTELLDLRILWDWRDVFAELMLFVFEVGIAKPIGQRRESSVLVKYVKFGDFVKWGRTEGLGRNRPANITASQQYRANVRFC